jgi:hypothetical protein
MLKAYLGVAIGNTAKADEAFEAGLVVSSNASSRISRSKVVFSTAKALCHQAHIESLSALVLYKEKKVLKTFTVQPNQLDFCL